MALRCAVFASGGGSNFQALIDRKNAGDLDAEFVLFVGNNSSAAAFDKARTASIPTLHITPSHFESESLYAKKLLESLEEYNVELIVLAGYMRKLPSEVVLRYHHRIVNIHPGLLPAFGGRGMYGSHVHDAVIEYGAKVSGITIHFVDEEYDHGPIIAQITVPVMDSDDAHTLAERVLTVEHGNYWKAIQAIVCGRIRIEGRRVFGNV